MLLLGHELADAMVVHELDDGLDAEALVELLLLSDDLRVVEAESKVNRRGGGENVVNMVNLR